MQEIIEVAIALLNSILYKLFDSLDIIIGAFLGAALTEIFNKRGRLTISIFPYPPSLHFLNEGTITELDIIFSLTIRSSFHYFRNLTQFRILYKQDKTYYPLSDVASQIDGIIENQIRLDPMGFFQTIYTFKLFPQQYSDMNKGNIYLSYINEQGKEKRIKIIKDGFMTIEDLVQDNIELRKFFERVIDKNIQEKGI